MKRTSRTFVIILALTAMLISACGSASATESSAGAGKPQASLVEFTGVIEAINGNQWTVNGQVITVDAAVVRDGAFIVGDTVKVEVNVQPDGSAVATRVELPGAVVDNSNSNTNANENPVDDNSNTGNSNDNDSNTVGVPGAGIVFDNSSSEAYGTVDGFDANTIVIGGQSFTVANGAEFKNAIQAGNYVKVHFILNADGSMSITQVELWDPTTVVGGGANSNSNLNSNSNSNGNDDNGNAGNNNGDDHGGNDNNNDDKNDDNSGSGNDND